MIEISPGIKIKANELHFEFIRASGPGGQNINKVSTAVRLRFDTHSASLPADVRSRLRQLAGKRISEDGYLLLEAGQFRTQAQNRAEAVRRFTSLLRRAAIKPKSRKKTQPTLASRESRLSAKKKRGDIKKRRRSTDLE